jgi:tetratricopeptide (TPR) repeat protein
VIGLWWLAGRPIPPAARGTSRASLQPVATPAANLLGDQAIEQVDSVFGKLAAIQADWRSSDALLGSAYGDLGRVLLAYDQPGAEAAFVNAAKLRPQDYRWPYFLGYLSVRAGRADAAIEQLGDALRLAPSDNPTRLQLAEVLIDAGRPTEAEPLLQEALSRDAGYYWVHVLLGRLAASQDDHETAIRYFERALELEPGTNILYRPLAMAYRALGDEERSDALLAEAGDAGYQRYDPLLADLGSFRREPLAMMRQAGEIVERQPERALAMLEEAEALDPSNAELLVIKAEALMRLDRLAEAAGEAERASEIAVDGPLGGLAQYTLATILERMAALEGAESAYLRAAAMRPEDGPTHERLAGLYHKSDRCEEALPHYEAMVERDPRKAASHVGRAMCLARIGRADVARRSLEQARVLLPDDPNLNDALARVLSAAPDAAVRDGQQAIGLAEESIRSGRSVDRLETLAMARAELGEFETAIALLREALVSVEEDGRLAAWRPQLEANLARYEAGESTRDPWPDRAYRR